jgi:1,4-alpha-glucan branching enzyme
MIKSRGANGRSSVTFVLDPLVEATRAAVCGEWDGWSTDAHPMEQAAEGGFRLTVELPAGRAYRFRYLLDGERWENDWAADAYVPNGFGGEDSLVDLTALAEEVPAVTGTAKATKSAGAKTASKKASAAKATTKAAGKSTAKAAKDPASKPPKKAAKEAP